MSEEKSIEVQGKGGVTERKVSLTPQQVELLQKTICKDHNADQIGLFLEYCESKGLDPFGREVYSIIRKGRPTFQIGIDGLRSKAEESGEYDGQTTQWCGEDGVWKDVWISSLPPYAAKVEIYRRGCQKPFIGMAIWTEYKPAEDDWMWRKMPSSQLAKCAEAIGLRKAFPRKLGGLYSAEEMEQAGNTTVSTKSKIAMPKAKVAPESIESEIVDSQRPEEVEDPAIEFSEPPVGMSSEHKAAMKIQAPTPTPRTKEEIEHALRPPQSKFFASLHAEVRKAGIPEAKMKAAIKLLFNKESSKDLSDDECAKLIKTIQKGGIR